MTVLKIKINNEKGLTLLEVLLSITLLSIVMISFLSFFTDAFRFNSINDDSIQAMNAAREQQARIKTEESWSSITETYTKTTDYYVQTIPQSNYDIKISIKIIPENIVSYHKLHLVHIEVMKDEKLLSETYTYFEE